MDGFQAVVLALIQGITEFLPISSSAHLVLPSLLLGWPDQGLAFDVAVHVGTLAAVVIYYRRDLIAMVRDWIRSLSGGASTENSRLVWYLGLATIPAGLVGLLAGGVIESHLRTLPVIASTTLIFGILLGVADRGQRPAMTKLTLPLALAIGLAQALAPVPGVSRSGVTITAALFLGLGRQQAARFSFLLSIPIIASAGSLKAWELSDSAIPVDWYLLAIGTAVAALSAYLCIAAFIRLVGRVGMMPFVYYRVVLALLLYYVWLF
ncbi:MAG: undecaprenyl-diphosphate phosphatase [Pseudomonadota bacterium]